MTRLNKLTALAAVVALSVGLAACGGGSSSTTMMDTTPDPAVEQKMSAEQAIAMAKAAVDAVTTSATDAQVAAANQAIADATAAVTAGTALSAADMTALNGQIAAIQGNLTQRLADRQAVADADAITDKENAEQAAADAKARIASAKALEGAIASAAAVADLTVSMDSIPVITDGDGTTTAITLKAGDEVGSLGGWMGMTRSGTDSEEDDANSGEARIYTNQDADKVTTHAFISEAAAVARTGLTINDGAGDVDDDYTVGQEAHKHIDSPSFPMRGTVTYTEDDRKFTGTFKGASGTYQCTVLSCTAVYGEEGLSLTGTWTFTPAAGAMLDVVVEDGEYLYFGWWVRKDDEGTPTHAGVLSGAVGDDLPPAPGIGTADLVGEATYTGKAAGKFAVSDPINPASDNSGHFTADAELMADFKDDGATLSGTIDAFRLNDGSEDAGWSVELKEATFSVDTFAAGTDGTVWSVGDNSGNASGEWEAQMFDEETDDDSNVPTTVVGSFMSDIGTTHSMVGAFGAHVD